MRPRRNSIWGVVALSLVGTSARADGPVRLDIPAQAMTRAILRLAVETNVSISAAAAQACGRSRRVRGAYAVETALRTMLAGSGCSFRRLDGRAYVIVAAPAPAPASRPAPSAARPLLPDVATELDDIVVTSTKQDLALANAPYALSAIDGAAFDSASRRDTAALATRLAGLTVTNLGPGRNKVFVRGLADSPLTGQTQAMVGLYLDDTRLTYDAPDPDLRLVDLQRVELLRGPQGALYGAGAMGGVLKLVSRPPVLDVFEADVTAGLTIRNDTTPGRSLDLVFNTPLIRDRLAMRVAAYQEELEGVIADPGLGLTNTGDAIRDGVRVGLLWRVNDQWEARLGGVFQTLEIDDSQYAFESGPQYERALRVREPSNNDFNGVSLSATGDLAWGRLKLNSAYQGHDLDRRYDATLAAARFGGDGGALAYDEADSIRAFAAEASLTNEFRGAFTWLVGLNASHYSHDRTADVLDVDSEATLYAALKMDTTNEAAVFVETSWAPSDDLTLILGGRYFTAETRSSARARQAGQTVDAFEGVLEDDGFSAKAVIEYAVTDRLLAYGQASQGYRMGGFNGGALLGQDYGEPGTGLQPYRQYEPDTLFSYEVGLRWKAFDDRLALRAAAFVIDWRSIQSDRVSPDGLPFTANIGTGGNTGLEIEGAWREGPWRIDFNLMGNDPGLQAAENSYPLVTNGDLPGIPKVLGAISAHRESTLWGRRAWISGSLGYVGRSSQQLTPLTTSAMGDYATSEIAAGIDMGVWAATMRVDNLLGSSGDTFGYGNPFLVGKETVTTPQSPASLSLTLSRSF